MTPAQEELLRQTRKSITVRQRDGSEQKTTVGDALIQKYIQTAVNGSPHALNQIARRIDDAERLEAEIIKGDIEKGLRLRDCFQEKLYEFVNSKKEQGVSEKELQELVRDFYPHPDDILFNDKGYKLTGSYDDESLGRYHFLMNIRDAYIQQHVLDLRSDEKPKQVVSPGPDDGNAEYNEDEIILFNGIYMSKDMMDQRSALMYAKVYNDLLPKRFQLTGSEFTLSITKIERSTKRESLRQCYQTWDKLNKNVPRGWLSPPIKEGFQNLQVLFKICGKATELSRNNIKPTQSMLAEAVIDIVETVKRECV